MYKSVISSWFINRFAHPPAPYLQGLTWFMFLLNSKMTIVKLFYLWVNKLEFNFSAALVYVHFIGCATFPYVFRINCNDSVDSSSSFLSWKWRKGKSCQGQGSTIFSFQSVVLLNGTVRRSLLKSYLISTIFVGSGICTLLQTTFGNRLPLLQGSDQTHALVKTIKSLNSD